MDKPEERKMTAREYLDQLRHADREVKAMLEYRRQVLGDICQITSDPSKERVQVTPASRVESGALRLIELTKEIDNRIEKLKDMKSQASRLIEALPKEKHRTLLVYRYCCGMSWRKVALRMNYNEVVVMNMHTDAIREMQKNM